MSASSTLQASSAPARRRWRPWSRRLVAGVAFVALVAGVAWVAATQSELIETSLEAMRRADPGFVLVGGMLVAARYVAAAVSLQSATPRRLPFGPTLAVQLASAAVGRITPEAVGWLVLNARFLERMGLPASAATAAISLKLAAGALGRVAFAALVAWSAGTDDVPPVRLPIEVPAGDVAWLLVAGLVAAGLVVAAFAARARGRLRERIAPVVLDLASLRHDPPRAARLAASTLALSVLPAATLAASAAAVGIQLPIPIVFAVYLVGTALAAASPTPGNLGVLEATLSAGLAGAGATPADALAAVLIYRLLTFWLPVLPGLVAFRVAQRAGAL